MERIGVIGLGYVGLPLAVEFDERSAHGFLPGADYGHQSNGCRERFFCW